MLHHGDSELHNWRWYKYHFLTSEFALPSTPGDTCFFKVTSSWLDKGESRVGFLLLTHTHTHTHAHTRTHTRRFGWRQDSHMLPIRPTQSRNFVCPEIKLMGLSSPPWRTTPRPPLLYRSGSEGPFSLLNMKSHWHTYYLWAFHRVHWPGVVFMTQCNLAKRICTELSSTGTTWMR